MKEYPEILTPDNIWIVGITQEPSTREYYLVFYYDVFAILDRFIQNNERVKYMQYSDFCELKEIGSGGYGTVYTAKYKKYSKIKYMQETAVLKRFNIVVCQFRIYISSELTYVSSEVTYVRTEFMLVLN